MLGLKFCCIKCYTLHNYISMCDQEEVAEFSLGLCCAEEERGETPGREDSPSDLVEADLDPGGDPKPGEAKSLGNLCRDMLPILTNLMSFGLECLGHLCSMIYDQRT